MILCGSLVLMTDVTASKAADTIPPTSTPQDERASQDMKRRLYVSGHSLTNPAMLRILDEMSVAAGVDLAWNLQYLEGSSIRHRRDGLDHSAQGTPYRHGVDRWGRVADPMVEFATRPGDGRALDTLVVTEQHGVLGSLVWQDTLISLRKLHDRFIQANPKGRTLFFEPWLSVDNKSSPERWIAYELAAAPVWRCIVNTVNQSLERDRRPDRIASMPMGLALAALAERLIAPRSLRIVAGRAPADRLAVIFDDDVHLSPVGNYYVASVAFRYLFREVSPPDIAFPGIDAEARQELSAIADEFVRHHPLDRTGMGSKECRDYIEAGFMAASLEYYFRSDWDKSMSWFRSRYTKWKIGRQWSRIYQAESPENPFLKFDNASPNSK